MGGEIVTFERFSAAREAKKAAKLEPAPEASPESEPDVPLVEGDELFWRLSFPAQLKLAELMKTLRNQPGVVRPAALWEARETVGRWDDEYVVGFMNNASNWIELKKRPGLVRAISERMKKPSRQETGS